MTRPCLPFRTTTRAPTWRAPAGSTDCHFHINGPYETYPLSPGRSYTPPEARVADYLAMAATLGLDRMVVVQPSVFGTDNRCTLDAVAQFGLERARAVVVVDKTAGADALRTMHARGARGVRFNAVSGNGTPLEGLAALARAIAPLGWHIQVYAHGEQLLDLGPALRDLPVPVVLDHLAGVMADHGTGSPEFAAARSLLETGRAYVKLSGYRSSVAGPPYADVGPIARGFIAAAPERCLWGTDWPHPSLFPPTHMPDDGELLDLLGDWAPDDATRRAILVDNPARLYGFG